MLCVRMRREAALQFFLDITELDNNVQKHQRNRSKPNIDHLGGSLAPTGRDRQSL